MAFVYNKNDKKRKRIQRAGRTEVLGSSVYGYPRKFQTEGFSVWNETTDLGGI